MTRVHVSFQTSDLKAATKFYTALFGMGPDKAKPDYMRFQPVGVPITLSILPGDAPAETNHYGVKLGSTEEVKALQDRMAAAGLVDLIEEGTSCCYAVQDKFWAHDPDGRAWEVYTVLDENGLTLESSDGQCCAVEDDAPPSCCG